MKAKQKCVKDIRNFLVEKPTTINAQENIRSLLECFFEDQRTRHVYVIDNENKIVGSVRLNTLVEYIQIYMKCLDDSNFAKFVFELSNKKVADVMSKEFLSLKDDMLLTDMIGIMLENNVEELPVVDEANQIVGEVNFLEFIKFLSDNNHLSEKV